MIILFSLIMTYTSSFANTQIPTCNFELCKKTNILTGKSICDADNDKDLNLISNSGQYQALSACEKQEVLWWNTTKNIYDPIPPYKSPFLPLQLFDAAYLAITFDTSSDMMPAGQFWGRRAKLIHTFGSTLKFEFEPSEKNNYTGVFKGGIGLMRLSLAIDPSSGPYTPGLGMKFLIDKQPSKNIFAMYSLDGQLMPDGAPDGTNDNNYFANSFSNMIDPPKGAKLKALAGAFAKVVGSDAAAIHLTLDHLADYTTDGSKEAKPKAPNHIRLIPTSTAKTIMSSTGKDDFRYSLSTIKPETTLYYVFAYDQDSDANGTMIGQIIAKTPGVASEFQDTRLFFQHQRAPK